MILSPPRIAYQKLKAQLKEMQGATTLDVLADSWEKYLVYHQRVWNKCEAYYKGKKFWNSLLPKYATLRKQNDLLKYIQQARHVDEHGILDISEEKGGSTTIGPGVIQGPSVIVGGKESETVLAPGSTAKLTFNPATVIAVSVENRGVIFEPPVMNGNSRPPVLEIAKEGIKFYDNLFADIDLKGGD